MILWPKDREGTVPDFPAAAAGCLVHRDGHLIAATPVTLRGLGVHPPAPQMVRALPQWSVDLSSPAARPILWNGSPLSSGFCRSWTHTQRLTPAIAPRGASERIFLLLPWHQRCEERVASDHRPHSPSTPTPLLHAPGPRSLGKP